MGKTSTVPWVRAPAGCNVEMAITGHETGTGPLLHIYLLIGILLKFSPEESLCFSLRQRVRLYMFLYWTNSI